MKRFSVFGKKRTSILQKRGSVLAGGNCVQRRRMSVKLGAGFNITMDVDTPSVMDSPEQQIWYKTASSWSLGVVESMGNENPESELVVRDAATGETTLVQKQFETHAYDATHDDDLDDVSEMADLHEAPLLHLLRKRHAAQNIYTYSGFVLLSVNPLQTIEGLYDGPVGDAVLAEGYPPHIHVIASGPRRV